MVLYIGPRDAKDAGNDYRSRGLIRALVPKLQGGWMWAGGGNLGDTLAG